MSSSLLSAVALKEVGEKPWDISCNACNACNAGYLWPSLPMLCTPCTEVHPGCSLWSWILFNNSVGCLALCSQRSVFHLFFSVVVCVWGEGGPLLWGTFFPSKELHNLNVAINMWDCVRMRILMLSSSCICSTQHFQCCLYSWTGTEGGGSRYGTQSLLEVMQP